MAKNKIEVSLFESIKLLIEKSRKQVVQNVNTTMVFTYFQIGRMIVKKQQGGKERAKYAKETITTLSEQLTAEYGKGYSTSNLEYFRQFYIPINTAFPKQCLGNLIYLKHFPGSLNTLR
jgi:hypothetical protein